MITIRMLMMMMPGDDNYQKHVHPSNHRRKHITSVTDNFQLAWAQLC